MVGRRPLTEGIRPPTPVDADLERDFVYQNKNASPSNRPTSAKAAILGRSPLSMRIRADYAAALKKASLERQLEGVSPNKLQDILEQALEPWLKSNGYID